MFIDDRIPSEVHHRYAYRNLMLPATYHTKITGWMVAITDNNIIDSSRIDVDYIRLWGFYGKDSVLIDSNEFNSYSPSNDGGLYLRYPFFPLKHDEHTNMPGSVSNDILTFYPSDNIYKVWHWWTKTIVSSSGFKYDDYKLYCRMRIIGHALAQAGIDFKTDTETNELGVSDWYFSKNGDWQIVTFNTKSFITTSIQLPVNECNSIKLIYLRNDKILHLKFSNIYSGNYILNIYNSIGKNIIQRSVSIDKVTGEIIIPIKIYESNAMIYKLENENGKSYSGKVIIL